jgi:hypothetical protein
MATGTMGAMDTYMKSIRNDAADISTRLATADARADELNSREANLNRREGELNARAALLNDAVSRFADMVNAAVQRKADAEEEQELETNLPGGEIHDLPAKQTQDPDDPDPIGDQGDLPEDLQIPELGTYPTLEDPSHKQVPQPVSVSLNAISSSNIEDDDDGPIA